MTEYAAEAAGYELRPEAPGHADVLWSTRRRVTGMEQHTARWDPALGWSAPLPDWDGPNTLVLVFSGSDLQDDDEPLRAVLSAFPHSVVTGCSTSGAILDASVYDESLTVAVARFESTRLALETEPVTLSSSSDVGRALGGRLRERGDDLVGGFVLCEGLLANGSALARGLTDGTGGSAAITGGFAGDGDRLVSTWVLVDGHRVAGHASAVGLYGAAIEVGYGSRGGWTPLGPERKVTRSEGSVLLELDGQPALALYNAYLGERAAGLPATALLFPLALRAGPARDSEIIRSVLSIDEARQSMTFAGDVPEGATAQMLRGTAERLVDAARGAARMARLPRCSPTLAIVVSCVGRRLYLGQRVEDELEAVADGLGPSCGLVGFYSYGELSPVSTGACDLHNHTMTITVLGERMG